MYASTAGSVARILVRQVINEGAIGFDYGWWYVGGKLHDVGPLKNSTHVEWVVSEKGQKVFAIPTKLRKAYELSYDYYVAGVYGDNAPEGVIHYEDIMDEIESYIVAKKKPIRLRQMNSDLNITIPDKSPTTVINLIKAVRATGLTSKDIEEVYIDTFAALSVVYQGTMSQFWNKTMAWKARK